MVMDRFRRSVKVSMMQLMASTYQGELERLFHIGKPRENAYVVTLDDTFVVVRVHLSLCVRQGVLKEKIERCKGKQLKQDQHRPQGSQEQKSRSCFSGCKFTTKWRSQVSMAQNDYLHKQEGRSGDSCK